MVPTVSSQAKYPATMEEREDTSTETAVSATVTSFQEPTSVAIIFSAQSGQKVPMGSRVEGAVDLVVESPPASLSVVEPTVLVLDNPLPITLAFSC